MLKKLFLLFIFLMTISSVFSTSRSQVDECNYLRIDNDNFIPWAENISLQELHFDIIQFMLDQGLTEDFQFLVKDNSLGVNLQIDYIAEPYGNGNIFGDFRQPVPTLRDDGPHRIRVNVGNTKAWQNGTVFDFDPQLKRATFNTLKHEIGHYVDIEKNSFGDPNTIFNISGDRNYIGFDTKNWYEGFVTDQRTIGPVIIAPVLHSSLNFTRVFSVYDQNDHFDEIVARVSAVCIGFQAWNFTTFNYLEKPTFCQNFLGLNSVNTDEWTAISEAMYKTFFLDQFPEQNKLSRSVDGLCKVEDTSIDVFFVISQIIEAFVNFWLANIPLLLISIMLGSIIGLIIKRLFEYIKNNFK